MRKVIILVIILAVILAIAGYWYWQRNPYSKEILKLEILGPGNASVMQEIEYTVKYKNNGDVRLEEPRLIFELPEYTLAVKVAGKELPQIGFPRRIEIGPEELGDIYPGEEKTFQFKGRLLGKQGEVKTAKVWLSYRVKNLQARYESTTTFTTVIDSVPLTFDFDLSSKVEAGRDLEFSLNYFSSMDYPLTDLGIRVEYPGGFEFLRSDPKGLDKTEWEIPLLNKAEGGRIEITGKLSGELREQKMFKAAIGVWQDDEFIILKEITKGVEITKPQLSIFQHINGQSNYTASPGDLLHYEVFFRNISGEPFKDLFLVVSLDGAGFDFDTIKSELGQLQTGDSSVIWDWRDIPKLKFLDQGKEGKVEFWINLKDGWAISGSEEKNAVLKNSILVSQVKEEFETKVNSKLEISQQASQQSDIYTITWQAKNYLNDVKNVKVKAILPSGVSLFGNISPESESSKFAFDSGSREIVWMVEDMDAGTGILNDAPNISFQVISISGQTIINQAVITGEDQWTESFIQGEASEIVK